jgi:hypothetical protein
MIIRRWQSGMIIVEEGHPMQGWKASVRLHFTRRSAESRGLALELFLWTRGQSQLMESFVERR